jgi:hypothetical protein
MIGLGYIDVVRYSSSACTIRRVSKCLLMENASNITYWNIYSLPSVNTVSSYRLLSVSHRCQRAHQMVIFARLKCVGSTFYIKFTFKRCINIDNQLDATVTVY